MIEHMFRLIDAVGIDHVGIGTDMPAGAAERVMPDFARHPNLTRALRDRGMSAGEVEQICAGNWLRVFSAARAWRIALLFRVNRCGLPGRWTGRNRGDRRALILSRAGNGVYRP